MKKIAYITLGLFTAACQANVGGGDKVARYKVEPEQLLATSVEKVSFSSGAQGLESDLTGWLNNEQPTRAELSCVGSNKKCMKSEQILMSYGVPFKHISKPAGSNGGDVILVYEKVIARDCVNYSKDKSGKVTVSSGLGCSVATNMLQMVSNRMQLVRPELLGLQDAAKSVQQYNYIYNSIDE